MADYSYLVINRAEGRIEKLSVNELSRRINRIGKAELVMGYDIHAGFNIPSNSELKELLGRLDLLINIDLAVIDERKQSNDRPYSPTSVYVVAGGREKRKSICPSRHIFVSEISLNSEEILGAYRNLLGGEFPRYSGLLKRAGGNTVGDFLTRLTQLVLKEKLGDLGNIIFRNTRFDQFLGITETSHPVTCHKNHDILYMGQHRAAYDRKTLHYVVNRFSSLGEMPYLVVIPIDPEPYFRV